MKPLPITMAGTATFNTFAYLGSLAAIRSGVLSIRDLVGGAPELRRDFLTWAPVAPRPPSGPPS